MQRSVVMLGAWMVVAGALGCQTIGPLATPVPEVYLVRQVEEALTIDGRLDEPAWQRATVLGRFYVYSPEHATEISLTEVRMLWDSEYLYFAFVCEDVDIYSYSDIPNDSLWNGDVVELFFKPSREELLYYEFVVAPNGTVFDARYPSRGAGGADRFKSWDSGMIVATTINGTDNDHRDDDIGYVVEAAIPWEAFREVGKPSIGTEWLFGAFRYDYSKQFEEPLLLKSFPGEAPRGFHSYESYGAMRFVSR